jgi:hypothetical protein
MASTVSESSLATTPTLKRMRAWMPGSWPTPTAATEMSA